MIMIHRQVDLRASKAVPGLGVATPVSGSTPDRSQLKPALAVRMGRRNE